MIKNTIPVSMGEALAYIDKKDEQGAKTLLFIKKFTELDSKNAHEMRNKLNELNFVKLNDHTVTKVIDLLPESVEEINKIFTDVSLDEDETNKIINIVKQFK
jgi:DNA-directed RNA polymerase subunit F